MDFKSIVCGARITNLHQHEYSLPPLVRQAEIDYLAENAENPYQNAQMPIQALYQEAIRFAAAKHLAQEQKVPGTELPYVVHLSNVAMEILLAGEHSEKFDLGFAVQVALLHDTLEDTDTTPEELQERFGDGVTEAVAALSKNAKLPKTEQMVDSLARIRKLRPEVWAVKMADRITNLQPPPPHWNQEKINSYHEEAILIHAALRQGNDYLAYRLEGKILEYAKMYDIPMRKEDRTLLLEVGGEGGSIQLVKIKDYFLFSTDETTLREFVPELKPEELTSKSDVFTSFDEAMVSLLDKYPVFELYPVAVHPDFRERVIPYYRAFVSNPWHKGKRTNDEWEEMLFGKG